MSADDLTNRTPEPDDTTPDPTPAAVDNELEHELLHEREQRSVEMAALETDAPPASDEEDDSAPAKPAAPPAPDAAPRIVSEAPFGGVKPAGARQVPTQPDSVDPDAEPPVQPPDPTVETVPSDAEAAALNELVQRNLKVANGMEVDQIEDMPKALGKITLEREPNSPTDPGLQLRVDTADATETIPPPAAEVDSSPPVKSEPVEDEDRISEAGDWDDSISPELAKVLFSPSAAARPAQPAAAPHDTAAPSASAPAPEEPAPAKPAPVETPPAAPIELTDTTQARILPITAEAHSAPAPGAALDAKVRYVRVEEPLKDDKGQRTEETWTYFKMAYPGLAGRLVRKVSCEERQYADGSWVWTYERRYDDNGHDRREIRANADRSYIERKDEVSVIDVTGKRLQFEEEAALILATPEREEKRGGILGGLFGRDKDDEDTPAARVWRAASSAESRQARKEGGDAFERGFLGGLFS